MKEVQTFISKHFKHFNSASLVYASQAYKKHIDSEGLMMITLAGAMSTAEIGIILAEMIRKDKVHIISCTGANLEEDVMNLIAHNSYKKIPHYRYLSSEDELSLLSQGYNRVTDTCIPEQEAFRRLEDPIISRWIKHDHDNNPLFPHEFLYQSLLSGELEKYYEIDPNNSWMLAAAKKNIPILVPGWEDSTLGNIFTANCIKKNIRPSTVKSGIEYMIWLCDWYKKNSHKGIGFFQIGGGIAGDFPICVVPMIEQDLKEKNTPLWKYFCQISDSTTSYGSYSGAVPNEKITWGKIAPSTPQFVIESDASIVAPLIFAYILDM